MRLGGETMAETIDEMMTTDPRTVRDGATIEEAARVMRDADIGDVIVLDEDGRVSGIVTDRDLVVRAVADGVDPAEGQVGSILNGVVVSIAPDESVDTALDLMRDHKIRRLPVIDDDRLVGIVTLGDLAIDRQPGSTLADISNAPPNN
jgi:CBS domain-containing protein